MASIHSIPDEILESIFLLLPPRPFFEVLPAVCWKWRNVSRFALGDDGKLVLDCRLAVQHDKPSYSIGDVKILERFAIIGMNTNGMREPIREHPRFASAGPPRTEWCGISIPVAVGIDEFERVTPESVADAIAEGLGLGGLVRERIRTVWFSSVHFPYDLEAERVENVAETLGGPLRPKALSLTIDQLSVLVSALCSPPVQPVLDSIENLVVHGYSSNRSSEQLWASFSDVFPNVQSIQIAGNILIHNFIEHVTFVAAGADHLANTGLSNLGRRRVRKFVSHFGGWSNCELQETLKILMYFPHLTEIGLLDMSNLNWSLEKSSRWLASPLLPVSAAPFVPPMLSRAQSKKGTAKVKSIAKPSSVVAPPLPTLPLPPPPEPIRLHNKSIRRTLDLDLRRRYDPPQTPAPGRTVAPPSRMDLFSRTHPKRITPGSVVLVEQAQSVTRPSRTTFAGVVIAINRNGLATNFTVRNLVLKTGVEMTFPAFSPLVTKIDVLERGKGYRRAKLYYLRERPKVFERVEDVKKRAAVAAAARVKDTNSTNV
ncbi:hypothetical protein HDU93_004379 [Gonapodya sp. JEL0774]|nr:hypothetical protein HDU93_004379 [Gonapodya sp. JEL0774]